MTPLHCCGDPSDTEVCFAVGCSSPRHLQYPLRRVGHLLTELGPAGHGLALTLLGASGIAMLLWLHLRRPATAADAMLRIVVGVTAAILLVPAARFGYLVYPLVRSAVSRCSSPRLRARASGLMSVKMLSPHRSQAQ